MVGGLWWWRLLWDRYYLKEILALSLWLVVAVDFQLLVRFDSPTVGKHTMDLTTCNVNTPFVESGFFQVLGLREAGGGPQEHFEHTLSEGTHVAAGKILDSGCQSVGKQLKTV